MFRTVVKALFVALPFAFASSVAICGNQVWGPSSLPSGYVGADYTHDDGGALIIMCDTTKKLISYLLVDPRAHWEKGTQVSLTTKADDGSTSGPSTAVVVRPTALAVGEQSTFDLNTMGHAKMFFAMGDGVYARIFPTANFREATTPVLQACGDHW
jgi:hypothetical protein